MFQVYRGGLMKKTWATGKYRDILLFYIMLYQVCRDPTKYVGILPSMSGFYQVCRDPTKYVWILWCSMVVYIKKMSTKTQ
jgi:hypothetical protein